MPAGKAKSKRTAPNPKSAAALRVLFPLDGSEAGYTALEKAFGILPPANVVATLLVVMQKFEGAPEDMVLKFESDRDDEIFPNEDSALFVMRQATRRLRARGVALTFKAVQGSVKKEILAQAANYDLIVMHHTPGRRRFTGATALARKTSCPVLLIPV